MDQKKLDRISELTRISRVRDLTDSEKVEREALRNEYRAAMRASLEGTLKNTYSLFGFVPVQRFIVSLKSLNGVV